MRNYVSASLLPFVVVLHAGRLRKLLFFKGALCGSFWHEKGER
jgi:hypothetical protein